VKQRLKILVLACTVGCHDNARPGYERCLELEQQHKPEAAKRECDVAKSLDPDTRYGKLAREEMKRINARIEALEARLKELDQTIEHLERELGGELDPARAAQLKSELAAQRQTRGDTREQLGRARNPVIRDPCPPPADCGLL
jgi:chromosome segregation ATPase